MTPSLFGTMVPLVPLMVYAWASQWVSRYPSWGASSIIAFVIVPCAIASSCFACPCRRWTGRRSMLRWVTWHCCWPLYVIKLAASFPSTSPLANLGVGVVSAACRRRPCGAFRPGARWLPVPQVPDRPPGFVFKNHKDRRRAEDPRAVRFQRIFDCSRCRNHADCACVLGFCCCDVLRLQLFRQQAIWHEPVQSRPQVPRAVHAGFGTLFGRTLLHARQ
jgi:hypothetical protein